MIQGFHTRLLVGRVAAAHHCATAPKNRACDFHRTRLKSRQFLFSDPTGSTNLKPTTNQISIFPARSAFDSINARRGSTSSPMRVVKI